jgi:hypothetical protein
MSAHTEEHPEDRKVRLEIKAARDKLERRKEAVLFGIAVVFPLIVGSGCMWCIFSPSCTPEQRAWSQGIVGGIVTGFASYYLGSKAKG